MQQKNFRSLCTKKIPIVHYTICVNKKIVELYYLKYILLQMKFWISASPAECCINQQRHAQVNESSRYQTYEIF